MKGINPHKNNKKKSNIETNPIPQTIKNYISNHKIYIK